MAAIRIVWTNKHSNETGFVKDVDSKNRHFVNTFEADEAKVFPNAGLAVRTINRLIEFGEGENNDFSTVTVE